MPSLERSALLLHAVRFAGLWLPSGFRALLTEPNRLHLIALFGDDDVRLLRMAWRTLRLVKPGNARAL